MNTLIKLWSKTNWSVCDITNYYSYRENKYMLFHKHKMFDHRVNNMYDGSYMCGYCDHEAPDGAIALLEMMNWEDE